LNELIGALEEESGCEVVVQLAEHSASKKAKQAIPGKPGIEVA